MPSYEFGPFVLDVESRVLLREGKPVVMTGKTLDTLAVLVENRGRLVRKDELLSLLWPGVVVEESNLSQCVFSVRKILGDSRKEHRYIATITGRGYQFVAPARMITRETQQTAAAIGTVREDAEESDSVIVGKLMKRYKRIAIPVTAVALAAIMVIWFVLHRLPAASRLYVARH